MNPDRRDFLKKTALTAAALALPSIAEAKPARPEVPHKLRELLAANEYFQPSSVTVLTPVQIPPDINLEYPYLRLTGLQYSEKQGWMSYISNVTAGVFRDYYVRLGATEAELEQTYKNLLVQETRADALLGGYHLIEKFNDNKVANLLLALIELCKTMMQKGINPGEAFSLWDSARVGSLINNGYPEMGAGLADKKFVNMYAGGICAFAACLAKAFHHAEKKGLMDITRIRPHSFDGYVNNRWDPYAPDSTVYGGQVDLGAVNTSEESIYIIPRAKVVGLGTTEVFYPTPRAANFKPLRISTVMEIELQLSKEAPSQEDYAALVIELERHLQNNPSSLHNARRYLNSL